MLTIFFIANVISCITADEERILPIHPHSLPYNDTPTGLFNSQSQKCCLGKVSPLTNREWNKCCGDEVYDEAYDLCCGNKRNKLKEGFRCCGTATYNTSNSICCLDAPVQVPPEEIILSDCCNNKSYNTKTQLCCYYRRQQLVVNKTNENHDQCCGEVPFDYQTEACCMVRNDKDEEVPTILKIDGNKQYCCGGELIDFNEKMCCNGKAYIADGNSSCCSNVVLNRNEQVCCYNGSQLVPVNITNPEALMCCSENLYDSKSQLCCRNKIYNGTSETTQCCNGTAIDLKKQLCCSDPKYEQVIVAKNDDEQDRCCGTIAISSKKELCCGTEVAQKNTSDSDFCCGNVAYARGKGLCCRVNETTKFSVIDIANNNWYCCGLEAFNVNTKTCCGDKIVDRQPDQYCCNDEKLYNLTEEICCIDYLQTPPKMELHPIQRNQACCGADVYNYNSELCCNHRKFNKENNLQCCGNVTFNTRNETCCGETAFKISDVGQDQCCFYGTTDPPECPIYTYAHDKEKK